MFKTKNKFKILVVDDQNINLLVTKEIIESNSSLLFDCDIANNGYDALTKVKNKNYQLILMDIEMPILNGIQTTKEIRKINNDIPIIAYTLLEYNKFKEKAKESLNLFNDYIYKDIIMIKDKEFPFNKIIKYLD